ncbi:MAG: glycosyltransferase [Lachnospiraceae bacterium]|nr:glycosyltransferase [Lachnospiraceae bacterium]
MAKVSILMPACNVEKFIDECMKSVISQTLEDIEIICVNDGSKDSTGEILDLYARKDPRVHIVHKPNSGYGHSMNVALDLAEGEYIGIVETDDYVSEDMFEQLYNMAKDNDADVVKANYYRYISKPEPQNTFFEVLKPYNHYDEVFSPKEYKNIMRVAPCIWSGIYRRKMLIENNVRFNETPGASYQDTSFAFKVWTSAERVYLTKEAYLHYRVDNENSSVKSGAKVFCLCDEYREMEKYLEENPEKKECFEILKNALKYESYRWNLERLSFGYKYAFLLEMRKEYLKAEEANTLDKDYFSEQNWNNLQRIMHEMDRYYLEECSKVCGIYKTPEDMAQALQQKEAELDDLKHQFHDMENSKSFKAGRIITAIPRRVREIISRK